MADAEPPEAGATARHLTARCLMAAWTTMQQMDRVPAAKIMAGWLKSILPLTSGASNELELAGLAAQAAGATELPPEQALARLKSKSARLWPALPEILSSVAVYEHTRRPQDAEAWLNKALTT
ncbi:MAG: hypothetical protein AABY18_04660 [Candidatus Thermoplasmatota archaeon]